MDINFFC
jgi:acyl-coenzyme A synthetase/AMP-(fatty) acid ligase